MLSSRAPHRPSSPDDALQQPSQPPISPSTSALLSPAVKSFPALPTVQERGPISKQRAGPSGYFDHSQENTQSHCPRRLRPSFHVTTFHSNLTTRNPLTTSPRLTPPCHHHRWICTAVWLQELIVRIALNAFRQALRRGSR
jgi:hypothetical protein